MRLRLLILMFICLPMASLMSGEWGAVSLDSAFKAFPGIVDWSPVYGAEGGRIFSSISYIDTIANKRDTIHGYFKDGSFIANKKVLFPDYPWDSLPVTFVNYEEKMSYLSNGFYLAKTPVIYLGTEETNKNICYNFDTDSMYFVDRVGYFKSNKLNDPTRTYPANITGRFIRSPKGEIYTTAMSDQKSKPLFFKLKDNKEWVQISDFLNTWVWDIYKLCIDSSGGIIKLDAGGIIRLNTDLTVDTLLRKNEIDFVSDPLTNPTPFTQFPGIYRYDAKTDILYGLNYKRELIYYKDNKWTFDTIFYLYHDYPATAQVNEILIDTNSNMYILYEEFKNQATDSLYIRYADGSCSAVSIPKGYERMFFDDKGKIWICGSGTNYLGKAVLYDPYSQTTSVVEYGSYLPTLHPREVFPNPASSKVTAKFWGTSKYVNSMTVGLYNSNGIKLKDLDEYVVYDKSTEKGSMEFNVNDIPSGVYYILYTAKDIKKLQGLIITR